MSTHLIIDLFWVTVAVVIGVAVGPTTLTVAMAALAVCHLVAVAVIVWAVRRRDRRATTAASNAEAGFLATVHELSLLGTADRSRLAGTYRQAVADGPGYAQARHAAFRAAVYSHRIERGERPGTRRAAIADWDEQVPGAAGLLLAVLTCDRVDAAVFDGLTGWWVAAGMPLYTEAPVPAAALPSRRRYGLRLAA